MGALITLCLGPETDHALYFSALINMRASIRDVASFAISCSLARTWCRQQMRLATMAELGRLAAPLPRSKRRMRTKLEWDEIDRRQEEGRHPLDWWGDNAGRGQPDIDFVVYWARIHHGDRAWVKLIYTRDFGEPGAPATFFRWTNDARGGDEQTGNWETGYHFQLFDDILKPRLAPPISPPSLTLTDAGTENLLLLRARQDKQQ